MTMRSSSLRGRSLALNPLRTEGGEDTAAGGGGATGECGRGLVLEIAADAGAEAPAEAEAEAYAVDAGAEVAGAEKEEVLEGGSVDASAERSGEELIFITSATASSMLASPLFTFFMIAILSSSDSCDIAVRRRERGVEEREGGGWVQCG